METPSIIIRCGSQNDSNLIETVPSSPVIKKRNHSFSVVPENSKHSEDSLEQAPCDIRENPQSQEKSLSKQARDLLLNYVKDPLLWQRIRKLVSRDIVSYSMSTGEYYKQASVMEEFAKMFADNDSVPFYKELRAAMLKVEELPPLHPGLIRPQVGVEPKPTPKEKGTDAIRIISLNSETKDKPSSYKSIQPMNSSVFKKPVSSATSAPVSIVRNSQESVYDKLETIKNDVFALTWAHSRPEKRKRLMSSCGKILVRAVFSDKEILEGNHSGRRRINCDKPIQKYDSEKICTIAKFLGWILSQPMDRSIENFKKWESTTKGTGLSALDNGLFWDIVIGQCTSDLRKLIGKSEDKVLG